MNIVPSIDFDMFVVVTTPAFCRPPDWMLASGKTDYNRLQAIRKYK
jgi:hypothetical protein